MRACPQRVKLRKNGGTSCAQRGQCTRRLFAQRSISPLNLASCCFEHTLPNDDDVNRRQTFRATDVSKSGMILGAIYGAGDGREIRQTTGWMFTTCTNVLVMSRAAPVRIPQWPASFPSNASTIGRCKLTNMSAWSSLTDAVKLLPALKPRCTSHIALSGPSTSSSGFDSSPRAKACSIPNTAWPRLPTRHLIPLYRGWSPSAKSSPGHRPT